MTTLTPTNEPVGIPRLRMTRAFVPIRGTAPLIVHQWSEKAKRQMLDAQQGRKAPKERRDPDADYQSSLYRTESGYGFPVLGFKAATVSAARFFDKSVTMTALRQTVFLQGVPSQNKSVLLTPIEGSPRMREDMVRLAGNTASLCYRGEFIDWSATLDITFVTWDLDSILSLVDAAGMGVGVGEWRPEKSGAYGTWTLDETRNVEVTG
jgi:hypothetical protein